MYRYTEYKILPNHVWNRLALGILSIRRLDRIWRMTIVLLPYFLLVGLNAKTSFNYVVELSTMDLYRYPYLVLLTMSAILMEMWPWPVTSYLGQHTSSVHMQPLCQALHVLHLAEYSVQHFWLQICQIKYIAKMKVNVLPRNIWVQIC